MKILMVSIVPGFTGVVRSHLMTYLLASSTLEFQMTTKSLEKCQQLNHTYVIKVLLMLRRKVFGNILIKSC